MIGQYDSLAEVRTTLVTTTNATGGDTRTTLGGNEIQKLIDKMIIDALNRTAPLRQVVKRKPMGGQLAYIWNIRTDLGSTGKAVFQSSEGGTGTPYPSTKIQYIAPAKAYRSDYEVGNLMIAGSASYYDAIADEARDALDALKILEEKAIICGSDTSAYGFANSWDGLIQLMGSHATFGDTDTIYGTARAGARDELDVQLVAGGASATAAFDITLLDSAITKSNKADGGGFTKSFLCSMERKAEIMQKLQTQQRFPVQMIEGNFGMNVEAYRNHKIIESRFMDKNGITWNGGTKTKSYADNAMYFLVEDFIEQRILDGVDFLHVAIMGADASQRSDVQGGFFKTYGIFVMRRFDNQVLIYNLSAP
jgi:hypothetical protein